MEKQIEPKVKPEEQKRHLIKAYLDDEEYEFESGTYNTVFEYKGF